MGTCVRLICMSFGDFILFGKFHNIHGPIFGGTVSKVIHVLCSCYDCSKLEETS